MNSIMSKIQDNIEKIETYGIRRIGLFGSFVRGEQTDVSDIDILVDFQSGEKTFDNYMDLKYFLEDLLERKVDLVIYEAIKPDLKDSITESVRYAQR